ncbi:MAG: hypothetical protein ABSA57_06040 [Candidatus Acidiferrales bacterium]|jgi:hypothetical protein
MLTLLIWLSGVALEFTILLRALQQKTLGKYPFFYLYVASLLLADACLYVLLLVDPAVYARWNWNVGFLNILLSAGILLEIFKHVLAPYPGAERFARIFGLATFMMILSFGIAYLFFAPHAVGSWMRRASNLERNLLAVQAIFLSSLVGVIFYYGIAIGRNLQGMIVGYGVCVATTLMALAFRSFAGPSFNAAFTFIQPIAYWVSLAVWVSTLWNYQPNPVPLAAGGIERDYDSFVSGTRTRVGELRSYLGRAARP